MFPICRSLRIMSWRHRGPMESATSWTPSQPCGMQMLTSECVTDKCHERGCNLPTAPAQIRQPWWQPGPLSTSLLEIAKPLFLSPRNRKGFRPSLKDSFRSFLFVVTACHNSREASLPEKGATEATSCPKGGNMWRHWYGLAQAWGSTTNDWTLGQILPRSREEGCQKKPDRISVTGKTRVYREGNLTVEEYTYGITRRGIRPYGHLAQFRGWPETRRANTSTGPGVRLLRPVWLPGGLGGFHQGSPSGELNWGRKRCSYPRVRGNGAASVTPASSSCPLLTQHKGRNWLNAEIVESCEWCSVLPSPQLCRCLTTHGRRQHSWWSEPSPPGGTARLATGTLRRRPPLSSGPTSVWRQPSLSAALRGRQRADQSFWRSGCGPRICAMLLRDTATLRLDLPPPRAVLAGSPPDRGRAWWEPWARMQAGVSRQRESRPARTQGTLRLPKTPGGPRPVWWKWARSGALSWETELQRLKGAPLKSSQDDSEVLRGHKARPWGIHPPGPLQEPHDEIMLSQGPAVHCIVVSRDSGYIHF